MSDLELREKVAREVMKAPMVDGRFVYHFPDGTPVGNTSGEPIWKRIESFPAYESDIAANEEMVRKMIDDGWTLTEQRSQTMYECKWRRNGVERKGLVVGAIKHSDALNVRATAALAAIAATEAK